MGILGDIFGMIRNEIFHSLVIFLRILLFFGIFGFFEMEFFLLFTFFSWFDRFDAVIRAITCLSKMFCPFTFHSFLYIIICWFGSSIGTRTFLSISFGTRRIGIRACRKIRAGCRISIRLIAITFIISLYTIIICWFRWRFITRALLFFRLKKGFYVIYETIILFIIIITWFGLTTRFMALIITIILKTLRFVILICFLFIICFFPLPDFPVKLILEHMLLHLVAGKSHLFKVVFE